MLEIICDSSCLCLKIIVHRRENSLIYLQRSRDLPYHSRLQWCLVFPSPTSHAHCDILALLQFSLGTHTIDKKCTFFNTVFVSSHMYPENPEGTQVIVGSMNMGYISDTVRNRTHNLFRPKREPIPLGHSDGLSSTFSYINY